MIASIPTSELLGPLNEFEQVKLPKALDYAGDLSLLRANPRVAIVGSRHASAAGLERAHEVAHHLVTVGGVVISGLATGIDRAVHESAIAAGGRTIGVLGTPLNRYYPQENRALQELMMREHLVLSQFETGANPGRAGFVQRNHTMALISHATVIIEAGEMSGTQSQAWEAIRLGRSLYLHASLAHADFEWPQKLLHYGAIPFESLEDLLLDPLLNPNAELIWE